MLLCNLIEGLEIFRFSGNLNGEVKNIAYDSRKVIQGSLFVCIEGFKEDGHRYAQNAIENGAIAIVASQQLEVSGNIAIIYVDDTREAMSHLADKFYDHPSKKFSLVGVTGTKGKTTTTYMISSILEQCATKVGLIGTIENRIGQKVITADRTTPESVELQSLFSEMVKESISHCVMEVSSHALELKRVKYTDFKVGIFTNLSRDHMDFHKTFDHYLAAKMKLFDLCDVGVINIDTEYGQEVAEKANCKVFTVGIHNHADIRAKNIIEHKDRVEFDVLSEKYNGHVEIHIPGIFTVYNALCAIGACMVLGVDFEGVKKGLVRTIVPGRAQVIDIKKDYTVMIDYAHTPDSLDNILKLVKEFTKGRLISVFGCGGDRDKTKRPIMGKISGEIADFTVITSDNPRSEHPNSIIQEIEKGIQETNGAYITIEDRRKAIKFSMESARKDDIILIAGKGHETYQILADGKIDFDEQKVVQEIAKEI
jgi:UDP-N-acetylmuramoyl-L-alanyl-D-glutamate--2,6-diaminopimelate ligase